MSLIHYYYHSFFVEDLRWLPAQRHAKQIDAALRNCGVVNGAPRVYRNPMTRGDRWRTPLGYILDEIDTFPDDDLVIEYDVVNPAQFSTPKHTAGHHLQVVAVYLGIDFKLFRDSQTRTNVVSAPRNADVRVEPYAHTMKKGELAFPATASTVPPITELESFFAHEARPSFTGTWRSKISLEWLGFGPAWAKSQSIPERTFVTALEAACEIRLLERGEQF